VTKGVWVEHHMGMPISIHVRGAQPRGDAVERAVAAAYDELRRVDETYSTYRPDSWVSRLRSGETVLALCPPEVSAVAARCEAAAATTGGAFTPWLPDPDGIVRFDPTGLVKGWAIDLAGGHLSSVPGIAFAINAGGDVLVGRHAHVPPTGADADVWRIGVEDPRVPGRVARVVPVVQGGVATSGTAARGAHLYDPRTGQWVGRSGSTTAVGPTLEEADIWATALFVGDADTVRRFAQNAPACQTFSL
jgi:thiamine biosynthesis lipoprotein